MAYELDLRVSASTGDAINNLERVQGAVQSVSAQSTQAGNTISQSMNQATQATQNYGKAMSDLGKVAQNVNTGGIVQGINAITSAISGDGGAESIIKGFTGAVGGLTSCLNPVAGALVTAGGGLIASIIGKLTKEAETADTVGTAEIIEKLKDNLSEFATTAHEILLTTDITGLSTQFGVLWAQLASLSGINFTTTAEGIQSLQGELKTWWNYLNGKDANGDPLPAMTDDEREKYEAPFKTLKTNLESLGITVFTKDENGNWQIVADAETIAKQVETKMGTLKQLEMKITGKIVKQENGEWIYTGSGSDYEELVKWCELNAPTLEMLFTTAGLDTIFDENGKVKLGNTDVVSALAELQSAYDNLDSSALAEMLGMSTTDFETFINEISAINAELGNMGLRLKDITNTPYELEVVATFQTAEELATQSAEALEIIKAQFTAPQLTASENLETGANALFSKFFRGEIDQAQLVGGLTAVYMEMNEANRIAKENAEVQDKITETSTTQAYTEAGKETYSKYFDSEFWTMPEGLTKAEQEKWYNGKLGTFQLLYGVGADSQDAFNYWKANGGATGRIPWETGEDSLDYRVYTMYMNEYGLTPKSYEDWSTDTNYDIAGGYAQIVDNTSNFDRRAILQTVVDQWTALGIDTTIESLAEMLNWDLTNGEENPIPETPAGTPEEPLAVEIVGETENTNPTPPAVMQTEDFGQGSGPDDNQPLPPNSDTSNLNVPLYISGVTSGVGIAPIMSIGSSSFAGGGEIIFTSVPVGGTGGYGIDPALTNVQNGYSAMEFASQSSLVDMMPTIAIGVQGVKILSQIVGGYLNASGTADTYSGNMSAFWNPASVDAIDMINQYLEQHPEGFTDPFGNTVDSDFISEALATMIQSVFSEENFADGFSIDELYDMMYENLLGWTDEGEIPYWRKLEINPEDGTYYYPMTPYNYASYFGNNSSTWMDPTEWRKAMYGEEGAGTINGDVDNSTNNGTIYNVQGDYVTNNYEAGYDTSNN